MRTVPEWIGATDDTPPPPRVKERIYAAHNGICPMCSRPLRPNHWDTDHIKALSAGGQNRESNLQPLCDVPCHSDKTRSDVAAKALAYRRRAKHIGLRKKRGRGFPTNRDKPWKAKVGGGVERRR